MKNRKIWTWVAGGLFLLSLVPFFLGAKGAHPATDDFTFSLYTHPTWLKTGSILHVIKDALSYTLRTWRDWQGTMTGVFIMTLNPAVFSWRIYGVHAVLLLLLHISAWLCFGRHFLGTRLGLPKWVRLPMIFALTGISLMFLPDMVEGIYWFNGAWFYTGAQAMALLLLTLADWAAAHRGKGRMAGLILCAPCLFLLGMDNYITAMMALMTLLLMALQRLYAGEKKEACTLFCLLPFIFLGLLISVVAPGNQVRMATDGAHETGLGWLIKTGVWTLQAAFGYILRFGFKTPVLAVIFLFLPVLLSLPVRETRECPPVWAAMAGFYLTLCAMIFPHMYSSGYAGSGRVVNMYHDYVVLFLPVLVCIAALPFRGKQVPRKLCYGAALVLLAVCLFLGQEKNYVKLISDQVSGVQSRYEEQFRREYALCEAAGKEEDVVLPAWQVQTMTGKGTAYTDPAVWTNESMAQYFGVRSVRMEDAGE